MHHYFAYGLTISSDLQLGGLCEHQSAKPDVSIVETTVDPASVAGDQFRNWRAEPGRLLIELIGEARILVEGGTRIAFERLTDGDCPNLASTIMGTGIAAILLQRELLPLHACCVKTTKGAVLVMGKSGAGKSTTLTGLLDAGCDMMADDVTAVRLDENGTLFATPAFPSLRVWQDVLEAKGVEYAGLDRVRADMAKYFLPIEQFHAQPEPIVGIVNIVAGNGAEAVVEAVDPATTIPSLNQMIYRKNFLRSFQLEAFAFRLVTSLARDVPMIRYTRPTTAIAPVEVARQMLGALDL